MGEIATATVAPLTMREQVNALEAESLKREQVECPVKHYFSRGVYAREGTIPKGTLVTGAIHKYEQINILSKGDISVLTEDGIVRVQAPFTVVSPPGTKRIAYTHEESVWTTIFATDETNPEKIVADMCAFSEQEYAAFLEKASMKELK